MLWGYSWLGWIISAIAAVFVFLLLKWLIPLLCAAVGLAPPEILITLFCLLVALCVLVGGPRMHGSFNRQA
jgi:high-affinity Fe2+/Pb2+ permease